MDFINYLSTFIYFFLDFIYSIKMIIITLSLIIIYHIVLFLIRDKNYTKNIKKFRDPEEISINDLKDIPLVNIIVPAWNEGETFKNCLIKGTK